MHSWTTALKGYLNPAVFIFLFLGFSCGLPFNLLFYSLSLWLTDANISLAVIGFFSFVLLPYNFKFLWAPFVDRFRIPGLADRIGPKKAWATLFQIGLILGIIGLACSNPANNYWTYTLNNGAILPLQTFAFALIIAFFAASQDIVVDALRIDTLKKEEMGEGAGMYQFGYRMGLLLSGAGVVAAAAHIPWQTAYLIVGGLVIVGLISVFFIKEPVTQVPTTRQPLFKTMVIAPFRDFMNKNQWALLLIFIVLYKACNAVLGRMALPFYNQNGFSKAEIALVSGAIGPWITIAGVALGGILVMRYKMLSLLFILGLVEIITSFAFAGLAWIGYSMPAFMTVIVFDNIVGGMGGAVFVAFLSGLCNRAYSATQYALLTSLMMLSSSIISAGSGVLAQQLGWPLFFISTGALMIPALTLLLYLIHKKTAV